MKPVLSSEVTRVVLLVLVIGLLMAGSFWTLLAFLGGLIWAATIVVATWPVLLLVQRKTGGRRSVAVAIMTALVLIAILVPFSVAVDSVLNAVQRGPAVVREFLADGLGPPPEWVLNIPLVGARLAGKWQTLAAGGPDALAEAIRPYARSAATWVISATGGFGIMIVHILLTVILVAILYAQGELAARGALAFGYRMGRERGEQTIRLAGQAVRSVALGVLVTALVQSILAGLGLWLCGVPRPGMLAAIVFVLGVAQIGPLPIMAAAVFWLYWTGNTVWGTVLLVWSVPVIALDNVLRPILIRRGVQLPMLLIIAGVIGGLISFGVMGLFIGPVVLAATYTLAKDWVAEGWPDDSPEEITARASETAAEPHLPLSDRTPRS
ncbi:MAG TPA: AI-2E family transporter YdiK [Steroidobacter sp.]|nr:AI-2E family transporter YdiK [Steroidobacter sp.]